MITKELQEIIDKVTLKPIGDRLLVYQDSPEEMTKSGLFIPDTAKEKPQTGYVIRVGTGKPIDNILLKYMIKICNFFKVEIQEDSAPIIFKQGDKILFGRYSGVELENNGIKVLIMREADVACFLDE